MVQKDQIVDGRVERGERTRRHILDLAVNLASVEGLEGLSIGGLADKLGMSKSGLFASFGSKEELQLAAIEHASQIFIDAVVRKAMIAPRGLPRLWALCDSWLDYAGRKVFRGGCFFAATTAEFDSHPGPIRDRLAALMKEWLSTLEVAVRKAQEAGHLRADADPAQLAFEIHSLFLGANWAFQLHADSAAFDRARGAIRQRLTALTPSRKRPAPNPARHADARAKKRLTSTR
ncbi:MAG TPA: TetR/AcrR family transcriptional regulator [Myxococcaceae bacterium]|nr:TetR/AcrR family transcriptional regulator [Myxococcaceae bacterium]